MMWELSIDNILAARDSDDEERKEDDNQEDDEYKDAEMEEGKIPPPCHPTFWTTGTNTNPFTLKWVKTIYGKKKVAKKDTL